MPDLLVLIFLFVLGACVGSFLNVVVWRLPRGQSVFNPVFSYCPKCEHRLAWYDNIPIFGWLILRGRCRYCAQSISIRYPIVELITALIFAGYFAAYFMFHAGPCVVSLNAHGDVTGTAHLTSIAEEWPILGLHLLLLSSLLAASLIDAELYVIPEWIPWPVAAIAIVVHAIYDRPMSPGAVAISAPAGALAAGAAAGLIISLILRWAKVLKPSFPQGEPLLEVDRDAVQQEIAEAKHRGEDVPQLPPEYTGAQIRSEIRKEMLFLMPPMVLAVAAWFAYANLAPIQIAWNSAMSWTPLSALLGAVLGGMTGAFLIWITRILGTLGFGRVAMGLGDADLLFAIGAVLGAGPVAVTFLLAPFAGLLIALYLLITRTRREIPYGPYLSLAAAFVMVCYCPIADYFRPGLQGLVIYINRVLGNA